MADEASTLRGRETNDADGVVRCDYCGRQFATPRLLALHHGSVHTQEVNEAEWNAVEHAREAEDAELRRLRIRMLLAVVVVYFGFLLLYATV